MARRKIDEKKREAIKTDLIIGQLSNVKIAEKHGVTEGMVRYTKKNMSYFKKEDRHTKSLAQSKQEADQIAIENLWHAIHSAAYRYSCFAGITEKDALLLALRFINEGFDNMGFEDLSDRLEEEKIDMEDASLFQEI